MAEGGRIKPDSYLKGFIDYSKKEFGDNLAAVVIYGSYVWGYFDKKKSDYDVFVIFRDEVPEGKEKLARKFPKVSLQYFVTTGELLDKAHFGHFTSYITLLKSGKVVYKTKEYDLFLRKMKGSNLFGKVIDIVGFEAKFFRKRKMFENRLGFKAAKWALPSIRVGLQLRIFVVKRKLVWDLRKVIDYNKDILDKKESKFLIDLEKKVLKRSEDFKRKDREIALSIFDKVSKETFLSLAEIFK